jgi:hypothetical protein
MPLSLLKIASNPPCDFISANLSIAPLTRRYAPTSPLRGEVILRPTGCLHPPRSRTTLRACLSQRPGLLFTDHLEPMLAAASAR